ncbi:unknown flavoprotein [Cyanidioschyzon merolae strain 10D]|jgi:phosphopantothenoylcysteine decarboxylase|uniref:Flavoprotein domain-containing protein n=1 Tax=Cyanidioschyzon merolae (strain NIES-3377 / 10D) TaxID=280699 RepID=M1UUC7_CYAM1|nr:unknown flavoprotein [Cyanidioschyzon merolae strain 10D]BAM81451.1 unknown flavoprotein [Cyanidioschyzon merolae strain 10D]|eukprot:XP_005537487.1 unknown flavoprotein [Cyanidioschyzon merolae strain 10D]
MRAQAREANQNSDSTPSAPRSAVATTLQGRCVVVGVTGSVAALRSLELVEALRARRANALVVATANGLRFLGQAAAEYSGAASALAPADLVAFFRERGVSLFTDEDEWRSWAKIGDPVLHIEIRRQADILVVAPASANALAKLAYGICDNLLLCVARAWELGSKPVLVAPAMNTAMWHHPVTTEHLQLLVKRGTHIIEPTVKMLACGDTGVGAMASVDTIVRAIEDQLTGAVSGAASSAPTT